jgi:hypothetical protein
VKKAESASKRESALGRKAERKALEHAETAELASTKRIKGKPRTRMTQYEILQANETDRKHTAARSTLSRLDAARITPSLVYATQLDSPNKNRDSGTIEASGVDNALRALDLSGSAPMNYKIFEAARMPSIKLDKPGLKASQYRDLIRKEWQRSPHNPGNA